MSVVVIAIVVMAVSVFMSVAVVAFAMTMVVLVLVLTTFAAVALGLVGGELLFKLVQAVHGVDAKEAQDQRKSGLERYEAGPTKKLRQWGGPV